MDDFGGRNIFALSPHDDRVAIAATSGEDVVLLRSVQAATGVTAAAGQTFTISGTVPAGFPTAGTGNLGAERVDWTRSGSTVTLTARAQDGTAAASHASGAWFTAEIGLNWTANYSPRPLILTVQQLAWCPLNPARIYVHALAFGRARHWMGLLNTSFTSATWADHSFNLNRPTILLNMFIHPDTGDRIFGAGIGTKVLPPPDGPLVVGGVTRSIWAQMPLPFPQ